jgi:hypothetical protein
MIGTVGQLVFAAVDTFSWCYQIKIMVNSDSNIIYYNKSSPDIEDNKHILYFDLILKLK